MFVITLALALLAAPEPWPKAECKSAFGRTACGYDCTSGFGEVACAETPYGKCLAAFGKVTCADPRRHILHAYHGALTQMECKAAFGEVACGYDCQAAFGQVACAEAPDGKCGAAYGKVTCWSPDPSRRPHDPVYDPYLPPPPPPPPPYKGGPKANCKSAFGQTACGFDCVAAFGQVKCAKTPAGTCKAAFGDIVCADPADGGRWPGQPKVECVTAFGQTACGYGCVTAFGQVQCAKRPGGVCQAAYGEIVCSE